MNFADLEVSVKIVTKRPDLSAETRSAILGATFELHAADQWWPDRIEGILAANLFTQPNAVIPIDSNLPRFRYMEALRPFDPASDATGRTANIPPLELVTPAALFDEFMRQRRNYFYPAGPNLIIRTEHYNLPMFYTYWQYPLAVSNVSFASWIAEKYPFAIINKAAAKVCTMIGFEETAQRLTRVDCVADMQYLRQNFLYNPG